MIWIYKREKIKVLVWDWERKSSDWKKKNIDLDSFGQNLTPWDTVVTLTISEKMSLTMKLGVQFSEQEIKGCYQECSKP